MIKPLVAINLSNLSFISYEPQTVKTADVRYSLFSTQGSQEEQSIALFQEHQFRSMLLLPSMSIPPSVQCRFCHQFRSTTSSLSLLSSVLLHLLRSSHTLSVSLPSQFNFQCRFHQHQFRSNFPWSYHIPSVSVLSQLNFQCQFHHPFLSLLPSVSLLFPRSSHTPLVSMLSQLNFQSQQSGSGDRRR
jgi:hypothetical protein